MNNAHPAVDFAVLAAIAELPGVEPDWKAEYTRLYKASLLELGSPDYFAKLAVELTATYGRRVDLECEVSGRGLCEIRAYVHDRCNCAGSFTPEFNDIRDLLNYLATTYGPQPEVPSDEDQHLDAVPLVATESSAPAAVL